MRLFAPRRLCPRPAEPGAARAAGPAAVLERHGAEAGDRRVRRASTRPGSPEFVPPAERIATFDNDGTLWAEQPVYVQLLFVIDRVKALAARHPEWRTQQPFAAVLEGDLARLGSFSERS